MTMTTTPSPADWQRLAPHPLNNVGVNARTFDPEILSKTRVVQLDGAAF